ncbi:hypothetical protein WA577_003119 [Blastocystis sp. JDR]
MTYEHFHNPDLLTMKKVGVINFAELFYGPTYHVKDFSMQFIGQLLKFLVDKDDEHDRCQIYAVVVGTNSDTGAAMLAGTGYIDYRVNGFSIYPRDKIGYIQEREMISNVTSNGHSLCMEKSGIAEVLRITRDLVVHNTHRDRIHLISANSCNIVRVLCEIPIVFYTYFHSTEFPRKLSIATTSTNLKSLYSLLLCRAMGLPLERILVACPPDSTVVTLFTTGHYHIPTSEGEDEEGAIYIHSNLERVLHFIVGGDVTAIMTPILQGEEVQIPVSALHKAVPFVLALPVDEATTSKAITLLYHSAYHYLVCPGTASMLVVIAVFVHYINTHHITAEQVDNDAFYAAPLPSLEEAIKDVLADKTTEVICSSIAHPGKFPYFVAEALNAPAGNIMPKDIQSLPLRNSRISVIPNNLDFIRNYIAHICFDCVKQFYHYPCFFPHTQITPISGTPFNRLNCGKRKQFQHVSVAGR